MSRSLTLALILGLFAPAAVYAQDGAQLAALDPDLAAAADDHADEYAEDDDSDEYAEDEYLDEEEYYDEEVEYCGGGEMSILDEIWDEMEYGDARQAHDDLVAALRNGEVERWDRARALSILGELQVRNGEPGRAIVNFRRAERLEPGVTDDSRVALATALYLRGERVQAREEARVAHEQLCSDRYAVAGCYTANLILAQTERDRDARMAAADAASTLRSDNPDLEGSLDDVDARVAGS